MSEHSGLARRALAWGAFAWVLLAAFGPAAARAQTSGAVLFQVSAAVPPSAPEPIAGLVASGTSTVDGEVYLQWNAPDADTPPEGVAATQYTLKYATFAVGVPGDLGVNGRPGNTTLSGDATSWWASAPYTLVLSTPPLYPGTLTSLQLDKLSPATTLYFALRSSNSVSPNLSPIDMNAASVNQAAVLVPDFAPPALSTAGITTTPLCGAVSLNWTPDAISTATVFDFNDYAVWALPPPPAGSFVDLTSTATVFTTFVTSANLVNFATYYFQVRAYNLTNRESQNNVSIATVAYAVPTSAAVLPITGSTVTPSLFLQWTNPPDARFGGGVLVRTSGLPLNAAPVNFSTYTAGGTIGNGTVLETWPATAPQTQYSDAGLGSGSTYYYYVFNFFQQGTAVCYSQPGSQSIILQQRPIAPGGVAYFLDALGNSHLKWDAVTHFANGVAMQISTGTGYPPPVDLDGYNLYSSTCGAGGCAGYWSRINTAIVAVSSLSAQIPTPSQSPTFYMVRAANNFDFESGNSNSVDNTGAQYALGTRADGSIFVIISVPLAAAEDLLAPSDGLGVDLNLAVTEIPQNEAGVAIRSILFGVYRSDNGVQVPNFVFRHGQPTMTISDLPLSGALGTSSFRNSFKKAQNSNLDVFWYNGVRYLEMFGNVNAQAEAVSVQSSQTGLFELQSVTLSQSFSFNPALDLYPRVISPNGDGKNDIMFFITNVSGVTGRIFDIRGAKVADLSTSISGASCPGNAGNCLMWDGKSHGTIVQSGVYIYDLEGSGAHYTGTVAVKR